ncbi:MAG: ectonucleotide pyrophosphatase/phosphodiesterase [Candidatus Didemnitutus sp.]|nr:ectonucleotide pyrophosphatase/phosphodiesterase [Candidatus Didemnitutus sp.]
MRRPLISWLRLPLLLLTLAAGNVAPAAPGADLLILLSIDGFRWDYLDQHDVPTLRALAKNGVHARRMTPSFPTKTFPNHYTLVTGLRPESHGIVANWFFDPATGEKFTMQNLEPHWWAGGEPIWITAEKQGVKAGCFFWPGSETELQGHRASLFRPFAKKLTCTERVDGLLAWLDLPVEQRPRLFTLYFDLVDDMGHIHGPLSAENHAAVLAADTAVQRLLDGLAARGLREHTNLVIVSDHGMSETSSEQVVFVEDLMDVTQVRVESLGPNGGVRPNPGTVTPAELAEAIRAKAPPQIHVYLREEVPASLHYRNHDRIPPVVLIADDHWNIESKVGWARRRATYARASHGWDPANENMGALFLAQGPAFKQSHAFADVENIHVYNLLCAVLGITPAPNEGDDRLVREALIQP